jgi:hypothetical protein
MRSLWLVCAALFGACGPDQGPPDCPVGGPDFAVVIAAQYGPLPSDTLLRLHYGGRAYDDPEELALAAPMPTHTLFCYVSDRDGNYPSNALPLGGSQMALVGAGGEGGEGGEAFGPGEAIVALNCQLWTDGSADLDVVSEMYGTMTVKLQTEKRVCTVKTNVELALGDAVMN